VDAINLGTAGGDLSLWSLFIQADIVVKLVMIGLLFASVWVWAIVFEKWSTLRKATREAGAHAGRPDVDHHRHTQLRDHLEERAQRRIVDDRSARDEKAGAGTLHLGERIAELRGGVKECETRVGSLDAATRAVADTEARARQLATGGARLLFADMHPNLCWSDGALTISEMIGQHTIAAGGRGLLLTPSIFAFKPVPPLDPREPPHLAYPSRGIGTLWSPPPQADATALVDLLGHTRARLLQMLDEPLPTVEIARRLRVTPSAASQHLRVLHATGLVTRARDRRYVLYRRAQTGDELVAGPGET